MTFVRCCAWRGDARIIVLCRFSLCFVHIDLFTKTSKKNKMVVPVYVFREGSWQHCFIDFGSILDPFWEVVGLKNRKKTGSGKG